jgi:cysteine desulfuration protein SufE
MTIDEIQNELIADFEFLEDNAARNEYLIDLGRKLPSMPEHLKTEENIIKGCQSRVWLTAQCENGLIFFQTDSDALIVKGIAALLLRVFSGHTAEEIIAAEPYFLEKINLKGMLSMNRANGLAAMIKQIKFYALAFAHQV